MDNVTIFDVIINELREKEKSTVQYCIYENESLFYHQSWMKKKSNCILVKILKSRLLDIEKMIDQKYENYEKIISNKYYSFYKIDIDHYIFLEFAVNSHVYIPQFILKHFAIKYKDGFKVWYITPGKFEMKQEKVKNYKSEYGYFSMRVEDLLRDKYESKMGLITKKIYDFQKNKSDIKDIVLSKEEINDIFNFIDISIYRNPKTLKDFKIYSISDKIFNYSASDLITLANSSIVNERIFKDYQINFAINKTKLNFVLNDTMLSLVNIKDNGQAIFMPLHPKFAICLLHKDYYTNWLADEKLYYMNIEDENILKSINQYIYKNAINNKENIIGIFDDLEMLK